MRLSAFFGGSWLAIAGLTPFGFESSPGPGPSALQASSKAQELARLSDLELVKRCPTDCWREKNDEWHLLPIAAVLQRRAMSGRLSDEGWLAAIRAGDLFHTRATWPKGVPLEMWVRPPEWLDRTRITLEATKPDLGWIEADNTSPGFCSVGMDDYLKRQRHLAFGAIPEETREVRFDVIIEQVQEIDFKQENRVLWRHELPIAVAAVDSVEECLPSASGAELDALVRRALRIVWWSTKTHPEPGAELILSTSLDQPTALSGIGVSLKVDLERSGEVIQSLRIRADQDGSARTKDTGTSAYLPLDLLPKKADLEGTELDLWQLRVRGAWGGALSLWETDRWWKGEFTVPLRELLERTR